jgi:hypothetical protein
MQLLSSLTLASVLVFAANTTTCNLTGPANQPQGDFRHSVSTFECGPADGPATAILLARDSIEGLQPTNPYVRVVIQRPASELTGNTWRVGSLFGDVSAFYFNGAAQAEEASSGTVRIDRVVAQERVEGSVSLRFPSRAVSEAFSAPWIEMFILCG